MAERSEGRSSDAARSGDAPVLSEARSAILKIVTCIFDETKLLIVFL